MCSFWLEPPPLIREHAEACGASVCGETLLVHVSLTWPERCNDLRIRPTCKLQDLSLTG